MHDVGQLRCVFRRNNGALLRDVQQWCDDNNIRPDDPAYPSVFFYHHTAFAVSMPRAYCETNACQAAVNSSYGRTINPGLINSGYYEAENVGPFLQPLQEDAFRDLNESRAHCRERRVSDVMLRI